MSYWLNMQMISSQVYLPENILHICMQSRQIVQMNDASIWQILLSLRQNLEGSGKQ